MSRFPHTLTMTLWMAVAGAAPAQHVVSLESLRASLDPRFPEYCSAELYKSLTTLSSDQARKLLADCGTEAGAVQEEDRELVNHLLQQFAIVDGPAAAQWCAQHPDIAREHWTVYVEVVKAAARQDIRAAFRWAKISGMRPVDEWIWRAWAETDALAALGRWNRERTTLPRTINHQRFRWILAGGVGSQPEEIAEWICGQTDAVELLDRAEYSLLRTWAEANPLEASEWILADPKPQGFPRLEWLRNLERHLPRESPDSGEEHQGDAEIPFPGGFDRPRDSHPILSYVKDRSALGWGETMDWALTRKLPRDRYWAIYAVARAWKEFDAAAARSRVVDIADEQDRMAAEAGLASLDGR